MLKNKYRLKNQKIISVCRGFLLLSFACGLQFFSFAQPVPVKIFPDPVVPSNYSKNISDYYTDFNGILFYRASNFNFGWELWKTNGYLNGTAKVKNITGGTGACSHCCGDQITASKNKLFFAGYDSTNGDELWMSDGTTGGTALLKDINPGIANSCVQYITALGDTIFFIADDGVHGSELWMSDGTPLGTKMVKDIDTVPISGNGLNPSLPLTVVNGILYFPANNFYNGLELWRSDGSVAGTFMVKDINPGSVSSGFYSDKMFRTGNNFYFYANDGVNGNELWVSDGTTGGTHLVKDINPGSSSSNITFMNNIGDSLVYFAADDGLYGKEFWRSNGTLVGTYMVKDFNVGSGNGYGTYFMPLFEQNNQYYMSANVNSIYGTELYKTDAFLNAFTLIKDISMGSASSSLGYFTTLGNVFYFVENTGIGTDTLWVSDGTSAGTKSVKYKQGTNVSNADFLTTSGTKFYFRSSELWKIDTCQVLTITGTTDSASGSININVTGGIQPYFSYLWSNGNTTQNVSGLTQGTYTVTVWDNIGCSSSNSFFLNTTVGIYETNKQTNKISIIPNPFSYLTTLQTDNLFKNTTLTIDNCFGQTVKQIKNINGQSITLSRDNLASGLYFIRLTQDGNTLAVDKLVITDK